ncbi:MAG: methyltransferase domain-containing protein [Oscillospiraceae bacterium]|nr:methyltransferase domain-containing protein [Oscillospiraceae bacterium]
MEENIKIVQDFYNENSLSEWNRITGRPEFLLTCRMFDRYIKPGDKVLDIGGGPGRYSFYLAEKGGDVTLFDLSPENVKFADEKSTELNLPVRTVCGDARTADKIITGQVQFDHVLLMGPMYHLLEETDRVTAVNAALNLLKPGGIIYVSFISTFGGIVFGMKTCPDFVAWETDKEFIEQVVSRKSLRGDKGNTFTITYMIEKDEILPFMAQFPLEKLHLFGQESITSPCENNIMSQPKEIIKLWLDLCEKLWEREDLLSWSEHLMYVGRKI